MPMVPNNSTINTNHAVSTQRHSTVGSSNFSGVRNTNIDNLSKQNSDAKKVFSRILTSFASVQLVKVKYASKTHNTSYLSGADSASKYSQHRSQAPHKNSITNGVNKQTHHGRKPVDRGVRHSQKPSHQCVNAAKAHNATHTPAAQVTTVICQPGNQHSRGRQSHRLARSNAEVSGNKPSPYLPVKRNTQFPQSKKTVRRNTANFLKYELEDVIFELMKKSAPPLPMRMFPSIALASSSRLVKAVVRHPALSAQPAAIVVEADRFIRSTDDQDWDALDADDKFGQTLIDVLAQSEGITVEAAAAQCDIVALKTCHFFLKSGDPLVNWRALSDIERRVVNAENLLIDQGDDLTRSDAFIRVKERFNQLNLTFDRVYADALKVNDLAKDAEFIRCVQTSPAAALLRAFKMEGIPSVFFYGYQTSFLDWQQRPLAFDRAVIAYAYRDSPDPNAAWLLDSQHSTDLNPLREKFKQAIGLDLACQHEIRAILTVLEYDGARFNNANGTTFDAFHAHPNLLEMLFFSALNTAQKEVLFNIVRMQTGESALPFNTLAHAVETLLNRFSDGAYLDEAKYPQGRDAFFNLLVAGHFVKSNDVLKIDDAWAAIFLEKLVSRYSDLKALRVWFNAHIKPLNGGDIDLNFVTKVANSLRDISRATPDPAVQDWQEFIDFAQEVLVENNGTKGVYSGNSLEEIVSTLNDRMQRELGGVARPETISGWVTWLQTQHAGTTFAHVKYASAGVQKTFIRQSLHDASTLAPWPDCTEALSALTDIVDQDSGWPLLSLEERNVPKEYSSLVLMKNSGHNNLVARVEGQECQIELVDGKRPTTVWKTPTGQWRDMQFGGLNDAPFGQLLANDGKGNFYSCWHGGLTIANAMIGGRPLHEVTTTQGVPSILAMLKNFSIQNPGGQFDEMFNVIKHYVDGINTDPRMVFIKACESWVYAAIVNEIQPFISGWKIQYIEDANPYTDIGDNIIMMIRDHKIGSAKPTFDLSGKKNPDASPIQYLTHETLHAFLQTLKDPPVENKDDQGLIVALTGLILQQAGVDFSERLSYQKAMKPLPDNKRIDQYYGVQWAGMYLEFEVTQVAPADVQGVFSAHPDKSELVEKFSRYLAELSKEKLAYRYPLRNAISVEDSENDQRKNLQRLAHLHAVYRAHDLKPTGLFHRLLRVNKAALDVHANGKPWHFVYLDPAAANKIPELNNASYVIQPGKVLARDPLKESLTYLSTGGMVRLGPDRQILTIMIDALTTLPDMPAEEARIHRQLVVELTNKCFAEMGDLSPRQLLPDTLNAKDRRSLALLNKLTPTRRRDCDEKKLTDKAVLEVQKSWKLR